jgi:hypothetical protein
MGYWGCSAVAAPTVTLAGIETVTTETVPYLGGVTSAPVAPSTGTVVPSSPAPTMPQVAPEETYPYDGGPRQAVPMPPTKATPRQQITVPAETVPDRAVSLPRRGTKIAYPAYGERPRRTTSRGDTLLTQRR